MSDTSITALIPLAALHPPSKHPQTLNAEILATVILSFIFITVFTVLRLIAKRLNGRWTFDDYVLIVSWAFQIAYGGVTLAWRDAGIGHHILDVNLKNLNQIYKLGYVISVLYGPMVWLGKYALILQLKRIFAPRKQSSPAVYWVCHGLIWGNLLFYGICFFINMFRCRPMRIAWEPQHGNCLKTDAIWTAVGTINVVSDIMILLLPLWAIWHLRMAPKRKIGISAVFLTGILAVVSSICRLAYTTQLFHTIDFTYRFTQLELWTLAEAATITLCTCFPMMPRLWQFVREKRAKSRGNSSDPESNSGRPMLRGTPNQHGSEPRNDRTNTSSPEKGTNLSLPDNNSHGRSFSGSEKDSVTHEPAQRIHSIDV